MSNSYRSYRRARGLESKGSSKYEFTWFGNNRHVCDVLADMRKCVESMNFSALAGLIEEAQVMANRMEAALSDQKDLLKINTEVSKARKAYKALEREYKELEAKFPKVPKPSPKDES